MSDNDLKHSISATIEGNVTDIIYVGELEIHTVLTYHCAGVAPGEGWGAIAPCRSMLQSWTKIMRQT